MMKNLNKILFLAIAAIALFSCVKEEEESNRSIQERILDAYVKEEYPNAQRLSDGLVMIDYVEGTGEALKNKDGGYFEYTSRSLSKEVIATTDEELAKEIGTYANTNHYGPILFEIGYRSTYAGLETVMTGMKVGGKAKFILPPWLTVTGANGNEWEEQSSTIYEIELKEIITDIVKWEKDTMRRYIASHYPGLDTLSSNFYFKKLHDAKADTIKSKSVNVRYIGRLLDGWVFDTNIADTAKKYGIYDSSSDYEALSYQFSEELDTMVEENSMVRGFCMALKEMSYGDVAFTMFGSKLGYDYSGKSPIGPYQPLIFWLHIEPEE